MADVTLSRSGQVSRKTNETAVSVSVNIDGTGVSKIATGVGFFDHMFRPYGAARLTRRVKVAVTL